MKFITIEDPTDPRLEAYICLTEPQLRNKLEPEKGIFIAEQPKVIDRALAAKVQPLSFLLEEKWIPHMSDEFSYVNTVWGPDIPVYIGTEKILHTLTGYRLHRGALCAMRRWKLPSISEICERSSKIAILENIVDPTNIGAIIRSAAALGMDAVLVTPSCGDPLYRRAARVSMGGVFNIPWTRIGKDPHDWPSPSIDELHAHGFTTAALALSDDSITLNELCHRLSYSSEAGDNSLGNKEKSASINKIALILGTEGTGLEKRTLEAADLTVTIPMSYGVDSLNVAACAAVSFWALRNDHHESYVNRAHNDLIRY